MLLTLDGKLHLAPVEEMEGGLHNVLDIATGTGIWAIDFGITLLYFSFPHMRTLTRLKQARFPQPVYWALI